MKVIVTGGAGFIGSHVVDAFLKRGDEVLVIDDYSSGRDKNLVKALSTYGDFLSISKTDICSDKILDIFKSFSAELVIHHAAQVNVRKSVENPTFDAEKNILGTVNLLNASVLSSVKTFMLASTGGAIYGDTLSIPTKEENEEKPECPYGVSKKCAEAYVEYYSRKHNITGVALRYSNVYGPRQNSKGEAGVVAIFSDRLKEGKELIINGDGTQTRDFVYVGDVVSANLLASKIVKPGTFSVYNVGTGQEISINELTEIFVNQYKELNSLSLKNESLEIVVKHGDALAGEQMRSSIDPSKIKKELNWKDEVKLKEGLLNTISYSLSDV